MRNATSLLVIVLLLTTACGSGDGPLVLSDETIAFLFGDPSVGFNGHTLTFDAFGAPADGRLDMLNASEGTQLGQLQNVELFFVLFWLIAYTLDVPLPDVQLAFDTAGDLDETRFAPHQLEQGLDLKMPLGLLADGSFAPPTTTLFHVGRGTATVQRILPSPRHFGLAESGLRVELRGTYREDATIDYQVDVIEAADSEVAADDVVVRVGSNVLLNLGPLQRRSAQHLQGSFNLADSFLSTPLTVEVVPSAGGLYGQILVEFEQSLSAPQPALTTRVHDLPFAPEGVWSEARGMFARTHPMDPNLALAEFAAVVYGDGFLEGISPPPPSLFAVSEQQSPLSPPARTYRGLTIGLPDGGTTYLRADGEGARADSTVVAARVLVGAWGISIANFDSVLGTFEAHTILEAGNMTDVSPFDGDPESGAAVYTDNTADALKFITRDAQDQYVLDPAATLTNTAWPGASGKVVSAFRHASGDLLFVTDGEPGELWVMPNGASAATKVGDAYNAPRTVRAAGNIAAVGSYGGGFSGGGGLSLFVRSAAGTWGRAPFSIAAGRSIGIDVKRLPDGRIAVVRGLYLLNTLNLDILDNTTGEVLDRQTIPLPAGCTGPGFVAFVREPGVEAVLVSCNTSNQLVLMPVTYGP